MPCRARRFCRAWYRKYVQILFRGRNRRKLKGMTIDERLEAITMNLELMSHQMEEQRERLEKMAALFDVRFEKLDVRFEKLLAGVEKLLTIAENHEGRLSSIEGSDV